MKRKKSMMIPADLASELFVYAHEKIYPSTEFPLIDDVKALKIMGNIYIWIQRKMFAAEIREKYELYRTTGDDDERQNRYEEYLDKKYICDKALQKDITEIGAIIKKAEAEKTMQAETQAESRPKTERERIRKQRCYRRSCCPRNYSKAHAEK